MTPTPHRKCAAVAAAVATVLACTLPARAAESIPAPSSVPSSVPSSAPSAATAPAPAATVASSLALPQAQMEKLLAAYAIIKRNYVGQADDKKLFDGAIAGMLGSLDAHSQYMSSDDMRDLDRENSGEYVGIGIEVQLDRDRMRVVAAGTDSPAARAGIRAGDVIASIDGAALAGLSSSEVGRRMRGAPGSVVTVGLVQGSGREGKPHTLRITRAALHDATVTARMAAPGLAWIRISAFGGATGSDLAAALKKLDGKVPPRGLVLDLRNDPGGLVPTAVGVAGAFLAPGSVVFSARGNAPGANATVTVDPRYYREQGEADMLAGLPAWTRSVPLTVLVNGASASAAELVAGALQDNRRATIVGSRTFGKGSIQSVVPLGTDDGIKFTVARYFTPKGHEIQAHGVMPDVVVAAAAGADTDAEPMLREADLANHLPPADGAQAVAAASAREPAESTRTFGSRDDKALQAALGLLAPERAHGPSLARPAAKTGGGAEARRRRRASAPPPV
ncbi:MAG: S41 family peptidase, partial [Oxalobacteraceae bacterium]